ncbi:MAG: hypothetical protein GXO88_13525, partial [Chlorobi bacterium]|nr:hypothetical protein [Chlorobiota bacterium]
MMSKVSLLLFMFLSYNLAQAQDQANIWHFGNKCGIDFNTGEPVKIPNVMHWSVNASASISDQDGNFLFSCNGKKIW